MSTRDDDRAAKEAAMQARIRDNVHRHGWHFAMVMSDGDQPPFAYTVGLLTTLGLPEVIVFGMPHELMHAMLFLLGEDLRRGRRYAIGAPVPDLLEGAACQLHPVHPSQLTEYFGSAIWFHQRRDFPALQLIWPGKADGIFPWQPGADEDLRVRQPDLRQPR